MRVQRVEGRRARRVESFRRCGGERRRAQSDISFFPNHHCSRTLLDSVMKINKDFGCQSENACQATVSDKSTRRASVLLEISAPCVLALSSAAAQARCVAHALKKQHAARTDGKYNRCCESWHRWSMVSVKSRWLENSGKLRHTGTASPRTSRLSAQRIASSYRPELHSYKLAKKY